MYHPCGTDTLHPEALNATGFSSNVAENDDVGAVGGEGDGVGDGVGLGEVVFDEQPAYKTTVTAPTTVPRNREVTVRCVSGTAAPAKGTRRRCYGAMRTGS